MHGIRRCSSLHQLIGSVKHTPAYHVESGHSSSLTLTARCPVPCVQTHQDMYPHHSVRVYVTRGESCADSVGILKMLGCGANQLWPDRASCDSNIEAITSLR
jgi:hypothetical protein